MCFSLRVSNILRNIKKKFKIPEKLLFKFAGKILPLSNTNDIFIIVLKM